MFLTSLVYMDTSVNPNKILGHVQVNEFDENSVVFDSGKFLYKFIKTCSRTKIFLFEI